MSSVWELDFYSRPILDEQQKKLWELLICDSERSFEYVKFCAGAEANARWLQTEIEVALREWRLAHELAADAFPEKVRFFRRPMTTIINRACAAIPLPCQASRRTTALSQWLEERSQTIYPEHPGYQALSTPPATFELPQPQPLPDALVGQRWAFASLEMSTFSEMDEWDIAFGDRVPLVLLNLPPETRIPGLLIFSSRAVPLAGWMSGLELAFLKAAQESPARLLLETGISDRWILANLKDAQLLAEAEAFETAKQQAQGLHFLAVQSTPETESFAGFWLLQELAPPL